MTTKYFVFLVEAPEGVTPHIKQENGIRVTDIIECYSDLHRREAIVTHDLVSRMQAKRDASQQGYDAFETPEINNPYSGVDEELAEEWDEGKLAALHDHDIQQTTSY